MSQDVEKNKRRERVKHILDTLPPLETVNSLRESDDLSRSSLHGALQRYVDGRESDCIFHAAFSVEMALLLRLNNKLTSEEKEAIKQEAIIDKTGLMFGRTISLAVERAILEKTDAKKAWRLNNLRNMHVHPANSVAFIKQQYQAATNTKQYMPEIHSILESRLPTSFEPLKNAEGAHERLEQIANAVSAVAKRIENLPDLNWCAGQDTLKFQSKRVRDYYEDSFRELLSANGLVDLLKNAQNLATYLKTKYPYEGRDGYDALTYAYEILDNLGVI
jgi:hypothetical protein